MIDQNDDGEGLAAVAMGCGVVLVGISAAALRNDGLSLGEQMVADFNGLAQQAARIAAKIKDQPLQVLPKLSMASLTLLGGRLLELGEMNVADAGPNLVFQIDRRVRNFVADQVEFERLGLALANHRYLYVRALGSLSAPWPPGRSHAVGALAVDRSDYVAWLDAGAERGRVFVRVTT